MSVGITHIYNIEENIANSFIYVYLDYCNYTLQVLGSCLCLTYEI